MEITEELFLSWISNNIISKSTVFETIIEENCIGIISKKFKSKLRFATDYNLIATESNLPSYIDSVKFFYNEANHHDDSDYVIGLANTRITVDLTEGAIKEYSGMYGHRTIQLQDFLRNDFSTPIYCKTQMAKMAIKELESIRYSVWQEVFTGLIELTLFGLINTRIDRNLINDFCKLTIGLKYRDLFLGSNTGDSLIELLQQKITNLRVHYSIIDTSIINNIIPLLTIQANGSKVFHCISRLPSSFFSDGVLRNNFKESYQKAVHSFNNKEYLPELLYVSQEIEPQISQYTLPILLHDVNPDLISGTIIVDELYIKTTLEEKIVYVCILEYEDYLIKWQLHELEKLLINLGATKCSISITKRISEKKHSSKILVSENSNESGNAFDTSVKNSVNGGNICFSNDKQDNSHEKSEVSADSDIDSNSRIISEIIIKNDSARKNRKMTSDALKLKANEGNPIVESLYDMVINNGIREVEKKYETTFIESSISHGLSILKKVNSDCDNAKGGVNLPSMAIKSAFRNKIVDTQNKVEERLMRLSKHYSYQLYFKASFVD